MPLAEAMALTKLALAKFDPEADQKALEKLAGWCEQFSPAVAVEQPDCLLMDITGIGHLFGGEDVLASQLEKAFRRIGLKTRIAVTDTFAGAWSLAHFHESELLLVPPGKVIDAIVGLPIASLNLPEAETLILEELGIDEIGQLLNIPRKELAARFDPVLLHRLDQATGRNQESLVPYHALPDLTRTIEFESPIGDRFLLEEVIAELLKQVLPLLTAERKGVTQFNCSFEGDFAADVRLNISLYQATANLQHLCELAALQLEKLSLPGPVHKVRLFVGSTALLPTAQLELFDEGNAAEHQRHLSLLVNRLSSRLGPLAVGRATPIADAQAEFAYRYQPMTHKHRAIKKNSKRWKPHQRPLQLLPILVPLKVLGMHKGPPKRFHWRGQSLEILNSSGPERIEVGWWRGNYVKRDYYRVETEQGNRYWLFRDRQGDWFLHGIFD
jgi:protein ImuB